MKEKSFENFIVNTKKIRIQKIIFICLSVLCLHPAVYSVTALFTGLIFALSIGNPWIDQSRAWTHRLLALSIIGLGASMDLGVVGKVGLQGVAYTAVGIGMTLLIGNILGRTLKCSSGISTLIGVGTAICGGSAIAAMTPVLKSKPHDVSAALATVFFLNAIALVIFPQIGHLFSLDQSQFGLWCALAIHDTSSVVGAALEYGGGKALEVATTVKLARALWIIPVTLGYALTLRKTADDSSTAAVKKPWFILGFLIAAALVTWLPSLKEAGYMVAEIAKKMLILSLFFIGSSLSKQALRAVGLRPLLHGFMLWVIVGGSTLIAIHFNWITP